MRTLRIAAALTLIMVLVALEPGPASAVTLTVTTTSDLVADDGQTSLREAFIEASSNGTDDEINLAPGADYQLTNCAAGPLVHNEEHSLVLNGGGATLTQTCTDEVALLHEANTAVQFEVRNLTIVTAPNSGVNLDGAAILADSQLLLDNVTVDGADAGFGGSVIEFDFGDAVFDIEVRNSSITNSTGSAISNAGNNSGALVQNTVLRGNSGNGLSISDGSPIQVTGSTISDNGGNAIVTSGQGFGLQPDVDIVDSFLENNAGGGFLCLSSCGTVLIDNSEINGNGVAAATGRGGGVVMPIVLQGTVPSLTIRGSSISGNSADHPGAGVFVFGSFDSAGPDQPPIEIENSVLSDNVTACTDCDGGAVALVVGDLLLRDSELSNNVATGDGGAVAMRRGDTAVIDAAASLVVTGTTFTDNSAAGRGGAISAQVETAQIDTSTFTANAALGSGGALSVGGVFNDTLVVSGSASVAGSTLSGNSAPIGGAVSVSFPDGSQIQAINSTLHGNSATVAGGALASGSTESVDLEHITMTQNAAPVGPNLAVSGPTTVAASIIGEVIGSNCEPLPGAVPLIVPNVVSLGDNWIDDSSCAPAGSDLVDAGGDPQLGPLANNGGPTLTRLPAATSGAAGLVAPADCGPLTDQRGLSRPVGPACDSGSVEVLEQLEDLPDGLPATVAGGDLRFTGDSASERLELEFRPGYVAITYDADLDDPFNAVLEGFLPGPFDDVRVRMNGGDDEVEITGGDLSGLLQILGGSGDDSVEVHDTEVGRNLTYEGGPDDDLLTMTIVSVDRTMVLNGNAGHDVIDLFDINSRDVRASLGSGDDRFSISGAAVSGSLSVSGGSGDDGVILAELGVGSSTLVQAGLGDDDLAVFVSSFHRFRFTGDGGDDDVTISDSTFDGPSVFTGGSGLNSFVADPGTSFDPPATVLAFP